MALGSGLAAQFGFVSETTYGTAVTVNKFLPLVNESVRETIPRIESAGIIAGKRVIHSDQWGRGVSEISGDVGLELMQQGAGTIFRHMFGSVTTSTTGGVSTHTFSPGDLSGQSMTMQVGKPQVGGVVTPFTYAGVKVASWELAIIPNENITLGLSVVAKSVTTATALASATYLSPAVYRGGSAAVSISGSAACVRSLRINGDNGLETGRMCVGQNTIDEPLESSPRVYGGTATIEFSSTALYERFAAGGEYPIVANLAASFTTLMGITMNARFDGTTPSVEGPGLLVVEMPFKCVATSLTDDSTAIRAVIQNSQTAGQVA